MKKEILRISNIDKKYFNKKVLDDYHLNLFQGEIVYLIGLSESGKTTLANILVGNEEVDSGRIILHEKLVLKHSRSSAKTNGIFCIFNQMRLIPKLTVAENIFVIKKNSMRKIFVNRKAIEQQANYLLKEAELEFSARLLAQELTVAQQHIIELIKAQCAGATLVILDDITQNYTAREYERLSQILVKLRLKGMTFLIESRKMDDLIKVADRVTLLKEGRNVKILNREKIHENLIQTILTETSVSENRVREKGEIGKAVLRISSLKTADHLKDVSLQLYKGEVLGVLDMESDCSMALGKALIGQTKITKGKIVLNDQLVEIDSIKKAIDLGIGLISQDAIGKGILENIGLLDNSILQILKKISSPLGIIKKRKLIHLKVELAKEVGVSLKKFNRPAAYFDNYTLQKVLFHRWLLARIKVLILVKPYSKADVISKNLIMDYLNQETQRGMGALVISSNLDEVFNLCDRIVVLSEGIVKGEFEKEQFLTNCLQFVHNPLNGI